MDRRWKILLLAFFFVSALGRYEFRRRRLIAGRDLAISRKTPPRRAREKTHRRRQERRRDGLVHQLGDRECDPLHPGLQEKISLHQRPSVARQDAPGHSTRHLRSQCRQAPGRCHQTLDRSAAADARKESDRQVRNAGPCDLSGPRKVAVLHQHELCVSRFRFQPAQGQPQRRAEKLGRIAASQMER